VCAAAGAAAVLDGDIGTVEAGNARGRWQRAMTDKPVELDEHRGMAAQKSTETRRRLREVEADQSALRHRQQEFERYAVTAPSTNWPDAAKKARYLIQLFAATPEARDPRRQALIASVLEDLARLSK
jgi:SpoVK/Ycf46/Vps4 family AAA+-type ATPase